MISDVDENKKTPKKQVYDQRIRRAEDAIAHIQLSEEARIKVCKESMAAIIEGLQNEQISRDLLDEKKSKELKLTENNLLIDLNLEKQHRRESEAKISKMIDEKLYTIRLDLAKEKKIREEAQDISYS